MQSSRDSSVLRSLAVAFGDGLAFGVGMKLTQAAAKKPLPAGSPDITPIADRLEQLESRIHKAERAPATLPAAAAAGQAIDQQVLEAIVQAVEMRLKEQSIQVDKRFADLEAKVTLELRSIHEQIRSLASGADVRLRELQQEAQQQVMEARHEARQNHAQSGSQIAAMEFALASRLSAVESRAEVIETRALDEVSRSAGNLKDEIERQGAALRLELLSAAASQTSAAQAELDREAALVRSALLGEISAAEARSAAAQAQLREEIASAEGRAAESRAELWTRVAAVESALRAQVAETEARLRDETAAGHYELHGEMVAAENAAADTHAALRRQIEAAQADTAAFGADVRTALADTRAAQQHETAAAIDAAERRLLEQISLATGGAVAIISQTTEAALERRVAPFEAALAAKESTISELRGAAQQSERYVHDLLVTIGQMCTDAARHLASPVEPASPSPAQPVAAAPVEPPSNVEPPPPPAVANEPEAGDAPPPAPGESDRNGTGEAAAVESAPLPPNPPAEPDESDVPLFAQSRKPGRIWRIPLVSSFILSGFGYLLLQLQ